MSEYRIRIGEIAPEYQGNWTSAEDPFDIITGAGISFCVGLCEGMRAAREYLHDEYQVDWGSWVWRGTKEEIEKVVSEFRHGIDISLENPGNGREYAFVYIEMY